MSSKSVPTENPGNVLSAQQQQLGTIRVESEPGRGAAFTVELPLAPEPAN